MRKRIALILAVAMLFSVIMPMSVSAASSNSVSYVPTVDDEHVFDSSDAPELRIEEDSTGDFSDGDSGAVMMETQVFRLNLTNADFVNIADIAADTRVQGAVGNPGVPGTDGTVRVSRRTDTSVTVTVSGFTRANAGDDLRIDIPLYTEMDSEGEARVTIDQQNSNLTGGTYTFAIVADGETTAFVDDVEDISRGRYQRAGDIIIDEVTTGSLSSGDSHRARLRLPNNFEWENILIHQSGDDYINESGTVVSLPTTGVPASTIEANERTLGRSTIVRFEGWTNVGTTAAEAIQINAADTETDGRDLSIDFTVNSAPASRGSIIIGSRINVTRDANYGEVSVNLTGRGDISNQSGLVIAEYMDFGAAFEAEEDGEKEFFVGRLFDNNDEEYEVEFTIEETVDNSFISGRDIDFIFPDWIHVIDVEASDDAEDGTISLDKDGENEFSYTIEDDEDELTFNVRFTANGNAPFDGTEDIMIKISGGGIEEMEQVLAVAKKPVTVEVGEQVEMLSIGTMKQDAPEILISETEAGALMEDGMLRLHLRETYGGSIRIDGFDVEVVEGDIELKDDDTYGGGVGMEVEIDVESTEASTLRFYNIKMDVDRSAPMGEYQIDVRGTAVIENITDDGDLIGRADDYQFFGGGVQDEWRSNTNLAGTNYNTVNDHVAEILDEADFSSRVFRADYVSVGTPIDLQETVSREEVSMTVGQTTYMVGSEQMTMDVAPFVQDNRLMVPVAHVSRALGVSRNAVVWDGDARTVTIYADKVMQMEIGSRTMLVNGVPSDMGAAATIVSERTFVPVSRFARALGIDYTWDAAAQTVTFHEEK